MNRTAFLAAALILGAVPARADNANTYVQARVSRDGPGFYSVYAPFVNVNLHLSGSGSGLSFSGQPFSGYMSIFSNSLSINGSGVSAQVNAWGGNFQVDATVHGSGNAPSPRRLNFTMHASGRTDDPRNPPSFDLWDDGNRLSVRPVFGGREYEISGWMDSQRFGPEGVALVGLVTAAFMQVRPPAGAAADPAPGTRPARRQALPPLTFPLK